MARSEGCEGSLVDVDTGAVRKDRILLQSGIGAYLCVGLGSRAARLFRFAFENANDSDPFITRCRHIADAVDFGTFAAAQDPDLTPAILEISDMSLRRLAIAESLAKAGYDPNEARDNRGWWARETDGDASKPEKDWVRLPPGDRIDELGDLLEWIANAKPGDEAAIRGEIKRLYYNVGDIRGGDALNRALSDALDSSRKQDREEILSRFEPYTRSDPAEVAQSVRDLAATGLFSGLGTIPPASAVPEANVWTLGWAARGQRVDSALGGNLHPTFPVIDRFFGGIATSIKSIDLNAATYQSAARLSARIDAYVDQLAAFDGAEWGSRAISSSEIAGRTLNLAIPKAGTTSIQRAAIAASRSRAMSLGIEIIVTPF